MKQLLTLFAVFFVICLFTCSAQGLIGQSKEYLLKMNAECYIVANTDSFLVFKCDDVHEAYHMDESTHLCYAYFIGMPMSNLAFFLEFITKQGYSSLPIPSSLSDDPDLLKTYCNEKVICAVSIDIDNYFKAMFMKSPYCN